MIPMHSMIVARGVHEGYLLLQVIGEYGSQDEINKVLVDLRAKAVEMIKRGPRPFDDNALGLAAE